jgi:hypothetical protein
MNSRDRREPYNASEVLIRQALQVRASQAAPGPRARRRLMERAAGQHRRTAWALGSHLTRLFTDSGGDWRPSVAPHYQLLYAEALFGPRLGWVSFNQLMR